LSSNAAAEGRSERVVAKSDMLIAPNSGMDFTSSRAGGRNYQTLQWINEACEWEMNCRVKNQTNWPLAAFVGSGT